MHRWKGLAWLAALLLAAAVAVWVIARWKAWFGDVPEPPFVAGAVQDRVVLTPDDNPLDAVWVSWRCGGDASAGQVLVREEGGSVARHIAAEGQEVISGGGSAAYFRARLGGLEAGRRYSYRLVNGAVRSPWRTFTMPEAGGRLDFVFIGDVQDDDSAAFRFSEVARRCPDAAFWLFCGDMVERPTDGCWALWFDAMDSVCGSVPVVAVAGNHEYLKGLPPRLERRWQRTFRFPHNGMAGHRGRTYYIDYPGLRLVGIDTQGINSPMSLLRHRKWLDRVLGEAVGKWKVVVMHPPLHSPKEGRDNAALRWAFAPILSRHGVHLVLAGHDHIYSRRAEEWDGGSWRTPCYVTSSCSLKHYEPRGDGGFARLVPGMELWQHVAIEGDTLRFTAMRMGDGMVCDGFAITRDGKVVEL